MNNSLDRIKMGDNDIVKYNAYMANPFLIHPDRVCE
jgi:hypothetical protein